VRGASPTGRPLDGDAVPSLEAGRAWRPSGSTVGVADLARVVANDKIRARDLDIDRLTGGGRDVPQCDKQAVSAGRGW
jgi:hypothetical protein